MRAFGYLRLSQDRDTSTSIEKQRASVEQYCAGRDWTVIDWFEDIDISGRRESRPALDEMRSKLGECDVVVFHRIDRIMRSVVGFARLLELCQESTVELVSATEPFDTSTAIGRILVWLLVAIAEIEAENTSTRIRATHEYRASIGRPAHDARAFGRMKDPITGDWILVEDEAEVLRELATKYLEGMGVQPLCDGLNDGSLFGRPIATVRGNLWHPTALSRMLQSPRMLGYQIRLGAPLTDEPTTPAILDAETFDAVRTELARRRTFRERHGRSNAELTGIVRCETCKGRMYVNSSAGKQGYACRNRSGHSCRIPKPFLEEEVARQLFDWLDEQKLANAQHVKPAADMDPRLHASLSRLQWGREELMRDYYQEGRIDRESFEVQLTELTERIDRLREKLNAGDVDARRDLDRVIGRADVEREWPTMTAEERRTILVACVEAVWVLKADYKGQQPTSDRVRVKFVETP